MEENIGEMMDASAEIDENLDSANEGDIVSVEVENSGDVIPDAQEVLEKLKSSQEEFVENVKNYMEKFSTKMDATLQNLVDTFEDDLKVKYSGDLEQLKSDLNNLKFDGSNPDLEAHAINMFAELFKEISDSQDSNGESNKQLKDSPATIDKIRSYIENYGHKAMIAQMVLGALFTVLGSSDPAAFDAKSALANKKFSDTIGNPGCIQTNINTGEIKNLGICGGGGSSQIYGSCGQGSFCDSLSNMPCPNSYTKCTYCNKSPNSFIKPLCSSPIVIFILLELLRNNPQEWSYKSSYNVWWIIIIVFVFFFILVLTVFYFLKKYGK
jgi:hypothetical protein